MKVDIRNNKDFWAGMVFFIIGAGAILMAWDYPFGSTLRMGPGYFPVILSAILICVGIYVMLKGLHKCEKIQGNWSIRPLIALPFCMVVFGVLMGLAGFVPALIALCFMSAAAGREFRFKEVLLLTISLGLVSVGAFVWGLGLPYPLFYKFW